MSEKSVAVVCWNPSISGGKIAATGYARLLGCEIIYLNIEKFRFDNAHNLIKRIVSLVQLRNVKIYIVEGREVSLLFSLLSLVFKITFVTRIGRIYQKASKKLFWTLPHYRAAKVIAPSEIALKNAFFPIFEDRCRKKAWIIPNPLSIEVPKDEGLEEAGYHFLIIARDIPDKRLGLSLDIAGRIYEETKCKTLLVTNNAKKFEALPFIEAFEFGTVKVEYFFKNCRALLNFSENEGFSLVSFEAACYGVPTVSLEGKSAQNEYIEKNVLPGFIITKKEYMYVESCLARLDQIGSRVISIEDHNSGVRKQLCELFQAF